MERPDGGARGGGPPVGELDLQMRLQQSDGLEHKAALPSRWDGAGHEGDEAGDREPSPGKRQGMARQLDGGRGHLAEAVQAVKNHGAGELRFTAGCKMAEVCEYLVEDVQVDMDAIDHVGRTPLVWAISADKSGYMNIVRYLLDHGANPDHGTTLHVAAEHEQDAAMKILLDHHADIVLMLQVCGQIGVRGALFHTAEDNTHANDHLIIEARDL